MKIFMPIIIFVLLMLQGCTPINLYHPMNRIGVGFKEFKLSKDTYEVIFDGGSFTSQSNVFNFALRRSAELTKKNGYKYFAIIASKGFDESETYTTPSTIHSSSRGYANGNYTYGRTYRGYANTYISPSSTYTMHDYSNVLVIKMMHSKKKYPNAFNAEIILSNYAVKKSR